MLHACYLLFILCLCMSVKSSTELMLYVVLTMPTLNKALFIYLFYLHPIRSLLTSMLRKANIRYPSDVYTFSFEKGIKRSNYGEFLIVKNVLFMYTMHYRQQRTSTLRIWKVCLHSNMYA